MPTLAEIYRAINALQSEGVFEDYALGGTMAALFFAEATRTCEVLVGVRGLDFALLENYRRQHEFELRDGRIVIYGVPVRLVEPEDETLQVAIMNAQICDYDGVAVRVMNAETLREANKADPKSPWGYCSCYFGERTLDASPDAERYAAKRRWHQENARLPIKEKVRQLIKMQEYQLPLIMRRRAIKWWEKPWDIDP